MSRVMKVIGLVALFWMLFPAEAEADEKSAATVARTHVFFMI